MNQYRELHSAGQSHGFTVGKLLAVHLASLALIGCGIAKKSTMTIQPVASQQPVLQLVGHTSGVFSLSFAPDGKTLASGAGGDDNTVKVWDVNTGKLTKSLPGQDTVYGVTFSHDGNILASGSWNGRIILWDVRTWTIVRELVTPDKRPLVRVVFNPRREELAIGMHFFACPLVLWRLNDQSHYITLSGHTDAVRAIAFSPDGKWLATGSVDGTARLWDATHGNLRFVLDDGAKGFAFIDAICYSPSGELIATGSSDGILRLYDSATGAKIVESASHKDSITCSVFSADSSSIYVGSEHNGRGDLAIVSSKTGHVFNRIALNPVDATRRGPHQILSLALSPDGRLIAAASADGTLALFETKKLADPANNVPGRSQ